jgi:hypothetical protein
VTNFFRPPSDREPPQDLSDLYERIPEPMTVEVSHADEFFYQGPV